MRAPARPSLILPKEVPLAGAAALAATPAAAQHYGNGGHRGHVHNRAHHGHHGHFRHYVYQHQAYARHYAPRYTYAAPVYRYAAPHNGQQGDCRVVFRGHGYHAQKVVICKKPHGVPAKVAEVGKRGPEFATAPAPGGTAPEASAIPAPDPSFAPPAAAPEPAPAPAAPTEAPNVQRN